MLTHHHHHHHHHHHQTIVKALVHATRAHSVTLDRRSLDEVRALALSRGVPRKLLTRANLLSALMDRAEEQVLL